MVDLLSCGNKDELAVRMYLLKHGKIDARVVKEKRAFEDLISCVKSSSSQKCSVRYISSSSTTRHRTFQVVHSTPRNLHGEIVQSMEKPLVKPPESIHKQDLPDLFEPLLQYMHAMITTSAEEKQNYVHSKSTASQASQAKISKYLVTTTLHGQIVQTGSIIKVKWTKDDIGNTDWRPGW